MVVAQEAQHGLDVPILATVFDHHRYARAYRRVQGLRACAAALDAA